MHVDAIVSWMNSYWWAVLVGVAVAAKVARLVSVHWSERTGLKRWCLFLIDLFDLVKTTPRPGGGK